MSKNNVIAFSGGHHNSALEVAKALKQEGYEVLWLGHKHSMVNNKTVSQEFIDVTGQGIQFIELKSGKIHGGNLKSWLLIAKAINFCYSLFRKKKPSLIVTFGGYLAVPPAVAGWLLGIPVVGHEQTLTMGLANKAIFPLVKRLYLAWPHTALQHQTKVKIIGLPLPQEKGKSDKKELNRLLLKEHKWSFSRPDKPMMVISGGKQGSHVINLFIEQYLAQILSDWNVVHQTGGNAQTHDYERILKKRDALPKELKESLGVVTYTSLFHRILETADLVVGRCGAHTMYEVFMLKKKMVAIPLPYSSGNEQLKNAQLLQKMGLAVILPQQNITWENFRQKLEEAESLAFNQNEYRQLSQSLTTHNPLEEMLSDIHQIIAG